MALTDDEKAELRKYLGYTDLDQGQYSDVEGSMLAVSDEGQAQIRAILADLVLIEGFRRDSWKLQKIEKAEQVTLRGADGIQTLRHEGQALIGNLASILGLRVAVRYFFETGGTANQRNTGYMYRG